MAAASDHNILFCFCLHCQVDRENYRKLRIKKYELLHGISLVPRPPPCHCLLCFEKILNAPLCEVCKVRQLVGGHDGVLVCNCNRASFITTPDYVKDIYEEDFVDEDLLQQTIDMRPPVVLWNPSPTATVTATFQAVNIEEAASSQLQVMDICFDGSTTRDSVQDVKEEGTTTKNLNVNSSVENFVERNNVVMPQEAIIVRGNNLDEQYTEKSKLKVEKLLRKISLSALRILWDRGKTYFPH